MPRPKKCRRVEIHPREVFFKPQGIPLCELVGVNLTVEGLEAMRLADAEGLDHTSAAAMMNISRPTFSRILTEARNIVARALTNGWAIHIEGGDYHIDRSADSERSPLAEPCGIGSCAARGTGAGE
jgi:predicted DNA-binding protein (UPF0251 family)